ALRVAAVMDHVVDGPAGTQVSAEAFPHLGRVTVTASLEPGARLRLVKLVAEQRAYLDAFWDGADVQVEGDAELQQAVRFSLFHVLQAGARAEGRAIPAKGRTGPGYDGHCFWDTEAYVLPVLTNVAPDAVAHALRWRHSTLPVAREAARSLGLSGAGFAWRTIHGEKCSSYWPAGTAAVHINADVADAVVRYVDATGDTASEERFGLELLTETARLWASLG